MLSTFSKTELRLKKAFFRRFLAVLFVQNALRRQEVDGSAVLNVSRFLQLTSRAQFFWDKNFYKKIAWNFVPALVLFEGEQKKWRVKLCLKIKSAGMKSAGGFFYAQNKKNGQNKTRQKFACGNY